MKNKYNKVVIVQYEKHCSDREEACNFVNEIRDENPNVVFVRKEEIADPTTDESILVRITGWYYGDSSKSKKKQSQKKKSNTKE